MKPLSPNEYRYFVFYLCIWNMSRGPGINKSVLSPVRPHNWHNLYFRTQTLSAATGLKVFAVWGWRCFLAIVRFRVSGNSPNPSSRASRVDHRHWHKAMKSKEEISKFHPLVCLTSRYSFYKRCRFNVLKQMQTTLSFVVIRRRFHCR